MLPKSWLAELKPLPSDSIVFPIEIPMLRSPVRVFAHKRLIIVLAVLVCSQALAPGFSDLHAAPVFSLTQFASKLKFPDSLVEAPDGSGRLFATELAGKIRIIAHGTLLTTPFLDLTDRVNTAVFGQGMYDIAFHPDYSKTGFFYVTYVALNGNLLLSRFQVSAQDANSGDPHSEKIILSIPHARNFHYGGQLQFGPDGFLYDSTGDSGSAGDIDGASQNKQSLLGALLRIDVNNGDPYNIPPNNPFVANSNARPEVWAKGLRNPWRYSFDAGTGDLYIADVGEDLEEEIDYAPAGDPGGEDYGWPLYEGTRPYRGGPSAGLTFPVFEYDHSNNNCSISGGYVYRGSLLPDLVGKYIYGDYCSGIVWALTKPIGGNGTPGSTWSSSQLLKAKVAITSFGQDTHDELYVVDGPAGIIYQLTEGNS